MFKDQGDAYQFTGWGFEGAVLSVKGVTKRNASINFDNPKNNQRYELFFTTTTSSSSAKYNLVINANVFIFGQKNQYSPFLTNFGKQIEAKLQTAISFASVY